MNSLRSSYWLFADPTCSWYYYFTTYTSGGIGHNVDASNMHPKKYKVFKYDLQRPLSLICLLKIGTFMP